MSSFTTPLILRFLDAPLKERPFELVAPFLFYVGEKKDNHQILVPAGYRTDFASIPRPFHSILNPIGRYGKAAVLHDWLCHQSPKQYSSKEAAWIFREAMAVLGVPRLTRNTMHRAVVTFGPRFKRGDQ